MMRVTNTKAPHLTHTDAQRRTKPDALHTIWLYNGFVGFFPEPGMIHLRRRTSSKTAKLTYSITVDGLTPAASSACAHTACGHRSEQPAAGLQLGRGTNAARVIQYGRDAQLRGRACHSGGECSSSAIAATQRALATSRCMWVNAGTLRAEPAAGLPARRSPESRPHVPLDVAFRDTTWLPAACGLFGLFGL
jgi:hypothetical protein